MSRLVEPVPSGARLAGSEGELNTYLERTAKYIPGEIIAGYLGINGILASVSTDQGSLRQLVYVMTFLLCLALTPVYFNRIAKQGEPRRLQMILSTIAFLVWAYSLGGVFTAFGIHIPWLGSILLIVFTLVSGAFAPRPSDP